MKILKRILSAVAALFPKNMANSESYDIAPMSGGAFDFRKMVCNLLGIPEDQAASDMVNERYREAMNCSLDSVMTTKANEQAEALKVATEQLAAANQKLAAAGQPKEVAIKIADKEIKLLAANEEQTNRVATFISEVSGILTAANDKVTKAESTAANSRLSLRKFIGATLVKEGRLTKAQWEEEDKKLAGEAFANAEQFDAQVATLYAKPSSYGITSSIYDMLGKLGEANNAKGTATTAANEMQKEVNMLMSANSKLTYDEAWAQVKKTEKGKGLMAQMKQPAAAA